MWRPAREIKRKSWTQHAAKEAIETLTRFRKWINTLRTRLDGVKNAISEGESSAICLFPWKAQRWKGCIISLRRCSRAFSPQSSLLRFLRIGNGFSSNVQMSSCPRFADLINNQMHCAKHLKLGEASDCRFMQQSDGPWFDSGWPDFIWTFEHFAAKGSQAMHKSKLQKWSKSAAF